MRSPSPKLVNQLAQRKLCSPHELAACEKQVAQLCRDLPDFDSVWLDAMVQRRLLTPWQAEQLQQESSPLLNMAGLLCLQQLGTTSFHAVDRSLRSQFLLRLVADPIALKSLTDLVATLQADRSQIPGSLLLPRTVVTNETQTDNPEARPPNVNPAGWIVSDFVSGWSLQELLIRGGRFPWQFAAEIGRELLAALSWLEARRVLHGDLVLRNVRLSPAGRIVLTDAFVRRHLTPHVILTAQLNLRDCEGVAPEQINAVRSTDVRSELFALGCLLWQCLTSRPIVLNADPVARLMKLRETDLADVRHFVPDCPDWMANSLLAMTRRSPELRPSSAAEVAKQWRSATGSSFANCRRIARQMPDIAQRSVLPIRVARVSDWPEMASTAGETTSSTEANPHAVRHVVRRSRPWRIGLTAAASLVLSVSVLWQLGVVPQTLRLGRTRDSLPVSDLNRQASDLLLPTENRPAADLNPAVDQHASLWLWPLPAADAAGVINLVPGRHYLAADIASTGLLQIETAGHHEPSSHPRSTSATDSLTTTPQPKPASAVIHIPAGRRWSVIADQVMLRGLQIQALTAEQATDVRLAATPDMDAGSLFARTTPPLAGADAGLLAVKANLLVIQQSWITTANLAKEWACLAYHASEVTPPLNDQQHAAAQAGELLLRDTVLDGPGYGVRTSLSEHHIQLDNVLLSNAVSGLRCDLNSAHPLPLKISINQLTLRQATSLLDLVIKDPQTTAVNVTVAGGESVIAADASIIRLAVPAGWNTTNFQAEFLLPGTGNAVIIPPHVKPALWYDSQLKAFIELPDRQIVADSLLIAAPVFASDTSASAGNPEESGISSAAANGALTENASRAQPVQDLAVMSRLTDFEGPKLTAAMPGIQPNSMPGFAVQVRRQR